MREGWEVKTLGDVIEKSGTIDPRKTPTEQFQYVDVSSVSRKTNKIEEAATLLGADAPSRARRLIKSGDVIFATIRPTLQRIAQVPEKLNGQVCSTGYFVFRTKPMVEPRYLYYFLFSAEFMDAMEELQSGASYPAVNDSQVKSQTIPLPPLAEQKRIVALLDQGFAGIAVARAAASKNLKNARELFETTLNTTFTQKGEGWVETTLGETCDFSNGKAHEKDIDEDGQFIVVNSKFISREGRVIKRTNELKHPLFIDDIVMVMSDVPKGKALAKCFLIQENNKYSLNQRICSIRSNNYLPKFLIYQLSRHPYLLAFDNKGSQVNLRKADILSCPLFMPGIDAQKSTADRLDVLKTQTQHLEALYQQKIDALNELKQSLLQKAFAGELTTTQEVAA